LSQDESPAPRSPNGSRDPRRWGAVRTWPRVAGGRCTDEVDYPPEKIAFFSRNPVWCRSKAAEAGPHVAELVAGLLAVQALHRLRAAQGIVALADKHPAERVDAAYAMALAAGDPTDRTVRGILAAKHFQSSSNHARNSA